MPVTRTGNTTTRGISPITAIRRRFLGVALLFGLFASLATAGVAAAQDWTYRVRPGDTVWSLAGKYVRNDITWQRVQAYNRIQDPYHLSPGSLMHFPVAWLKQQPVKAHVVGVHGGAFVVDGHGKRIPVAEGMRLGIGTTLQTTSDGSLTLRFADGSRLLLEPDSELKLDKLSAYGATGMVDTRMRLPKGRASSEVESLRGSESHYIIQTPDIMSSVRGTSFRVGSDGGRSQVEVTEGHVQVAGANRQVVLKPNQGTISGAAGTPGAARALLAEPASLELDDTHGPMVLRWAAVPGAKGYRVQVGATPAFLSLLHDRVVADAQDTLEGLPEGTLGIRVRAIDAQGLEGRDATIEARIASRPPFAIEPAEGGTVDVDRPRFRWASLGPGMRYHFQLAGSEGFERPLVDLDDLGVLDLRSPQALPPGDYAWRIASIDGEGHSSFNDGVHFTVVPPGTGPEISGEAHDSANGELQVRWPAGTPGQQFRFQLSRDADFSRPAVDRMVDDNRIALPGLGAGTWHARVQAIDSDGYAHPFGPNQSFKVGCLPCRWAAGGGILILLLSL
jgi:hypothetical protein